tara:strand:- start:17873 stop:18523 length:651 start_codon:yes stop_codon:yes gene_type:complete
MFKKKISEDAIIGFLVKNPNFFLNKSELLTKLKFPSEGINSSAGTVVSFKDWMINSLKYKYRHLLSISTHNFLTQSTIFSMVLKILDFDNINSFSMFINFKLATELNLEKILLISSNEDIKSFGGQIFSNKSLKNLFNNHNGLLMDAVDDKYKLFGENQKKIYSNAIFSLDYEIFKSPSLLLFGSTEKTFIGNQGTELMSFLCMVINSRIKQFRNK